MPADPQGPKALEHEFGGLHAAINVKYMHIMIWSCPELGYAVTRNARYTQAPPRATLNSLTGMDAYMRPFFDKLH